MGVCVFSIGLDGGSDSALVGGEALAVATHGVLAPCEGAAGATFAERVDVDRRGRGQGAGEVQG